MKERTLDRIMNTIAVLAVAFLIAFVVLTFSGILLRGNSVETFELWDAKCPFGHYYTDIEGGGFIVFYMDSSLGEGYVLKFFDGDLLKTLIVDSVDDNVRVHLTEDTSRMWMVVEFEGPTFQTGDYDGQDWLQVDIYVPDPKLMEG